MSKEKLAEARTLIQRKQYDAARAILEAMPNDPTAQQWLTKLDEIAPRRTPVPPKTAKQPSGGGIINLLIAVVVVIILLVLVGAGGYFAGQSSGKEQGRQDGRETAALEYAVAETKTQAAIPPIQVATPTPSATNTESPTAIPALPTLQARASMTAAVDCEENGAMWWYDIAEPIVQEFFDIAETATQTARMSLPSVILSLQETARDFEDIDHRGCVEDSYWAIRSGMGLAIDGFNAFLGESDVMSLVSFNVATQRFAEAFYRLSEIPLVLPDIRMKDAALFVWGGDSPDIEALTPSPEPQGARAVSTAPG